MALVGVKYIGPKQMKVDNVAGTKLIWTPGQIHVVPASLVPAFQEHPNVWEICTVDSGNVQDVGLVVDTLGTTQAEVDENKADVAAVTEQILTQADLPASFDPMTKAEIAAFAHRNYGVTLDHTRMTKDALVQSVRSTHNARVQF